MTKPRHTVTKSKKVDAPKESAEQSISVAPQITGIQDGTILIADKSQPSGARYTHSVVGIAKIILDSRVKKIEFINIPNIYSGLLLVWQAKSAGQGPDSELLLQFNGDSLPANYPSGSTPGISLGMLGGGSDDPDGGACGEVRVPNYSGTVFKKRILAISGYEDSGNFAAGVFTGRWDNIGPIETLAVLTTGPALAIGSTFTLYGVG